VVTRDNNFIANTRAESRVEEMRTFTPQNSRGRLFLRKAVRTKCVRPYVGGYSFSEQLQSAGGTCAFRKSATRLYASI
jgi:hypothetical protein